MNEKIIVTRQQLYDDAWKISVSGVAKKLNCPYPKLLSIYKEYDIPYPASSYWTKLTCGKPVEQIPLTANVTESIVIDLLDSKKQVNIKSSKPNIISAENAESNKKLAINKSEQISELEEAETFNQYGLVYNKYNRETLYKEVWEHPVVDVAKKYCVSDVAIHKACKKMDIPTPPSGYWAKKYANKPVEIIPLPKTDKPSEIIGMRPSESKLEIENENETLAFLSDEEKNKIIKAAYDIHLPDKAFKMHKKLLAYKKIIADWNEKDKKPLLAEHKYSYGNEPPLLAGVISDDTLSRVYNMLNIIFNEIEHLGGAINDDLSIIVRGETIRFHIHELQDSVPHVLTKVETMELLKYEDERKRYSWASKPQIRKYDYHFNGKIIFNVVGGKSFRDRNNVVVESKLGDILIALYEESEEIRLIREKREAEERRRIEQQRLAIERQKLHDNEINKTFALENEAEDYDMACKIRAYANAVAAKNSNDKSMLEWVDWTRKKADWYDPTISIEDEILGKREHGKAKEDKALKKKRTNWYY